MKICSVYGCGRSAHRKDYGYRGMCSAHYLRWLKYGDPLGGGTMRGEPQKFVEMAASYEGDDCLIWPYSKSGNGYGDIRRKGRRYLVHRLVCEAVHGSPPSASHEAVHSCGNGHLGCVNPNHLSWATHKQNMSDMVKHGTSPRGTRHGMSKLTERQVLRIHKMRGDLPNVKIAQQFGVTEGTVRDIHSGRNWGWLTKESVS